jgi:hypothetical protein
MNVRLTLMFMAIISSLLIACGNSQPPQAVPIAEMCTLDSGTNVTAEGFLSLPISALICRDGKCKITFYDEAGSIPTEFVTTRESSPGKLTMPPAQYTLDDLQVTLKDGSVADRTTRVRITGALRKQGTNCYLETHATEMP